MINEQTDYISPKLQLDRQLAKGNWGLFTTTFVNRGELLVLWGGTIVDGEQLAQLPDSCRSHSLQVEENLYQVPLSENSIGNFVNHSCAPNAGLLGQIGLQAMRPIMPGEEVCFDYAMSDGTPYDEFTCACATPYCRGRVTGNDWRLPELQERYRGYFSPYLQRRINQHRREQERILATSGFMPTRHLKWRQTQ